MAVLQSLTPNLNVESIEACLPFWCETLGFQKIMEVPQGDALGFVMLQRDGIDLMLQTCSSMDDDMPKLAEDARKGATFLYLKVDDLDSFEAALDESTIEVPKRTTFYGATEITVRSPGGHLVTLAQFAEESAE